MPFLMTESDDGVNQRLNLVEEETMLGRHPDCQVVVDDAAVSRHHAKIICRSGKYLLEDLKSRNGTYLNRRMIQQPTRLLNGDRIRICDHLFVFHLDDSLDDSQIRGTRESENRDLGSSILLDDQMGKDLSSIMTQMEMSSHHAGVSGQVANPQAKLTALMEITRALGTAIAMDKVLPRVLDCLFDLFKQADRGFIVIADPDGNLKPLAMKLRREDDHATFRISRTIVRHVLDTKSAVISTDAANDDRFDLSQSIADFRIRSMMCAPLLDADNNSLGIIQLDTLQSSDGFENEDLDILATVAMQASAGIDRAKLYDMELRQQQLSRDLELANEVQHRLLPAQPPAYSGYQLFDYYRPAEQVGGDYFDYILLPNGQIAVLVGDVVGHGIAAALLMAKVSAEARFALASQPSAACAMNHLNQAICHLQLERFITIVMVLLDNTSHELTVVNAGHLPPLLRKQGQPAAALSTELSGLPIGVAADLEYQQFSLSLEPGDTLAIYTDGISEASNTTGELFGNHRVIEHMNEQAWKNGSEFGESLVQRVRQHLVGSRQDDDICLVCLSRNPGSAGG